jgi:hypothetical protein
MAYSRGDNDRPEVLGHGFIEVITWGQGMSREAMKLALEALDSDNPDIQLRAAIALRQALEEKQEPLYWSVADGWVHGGNCYGDGTVYRGERSKDSETPTLKAGLIDEIHMTPSEKLHLQAAAYANRRKEAYLDHLKKGLAEKISRKMVDWIWVAHYEGYREAIQELKNHGH